MITIKRQNTLPQPFAKQDDGVVLVKSILTQASRHALMLGVLAVALQLSGCAGLMTKDPQEVAQSWIGFNVSSLLEKWGNPPSAPFKNGNETGYYWSYGTNGGYVNTSHQEAQGQDGNGQMVMGEVAGGYYQPPVSYCELTFYTNRVGTITRYVLKEYDHNRCAQYVSSWGGPTKSRLF